MLNEVLENTIESFTVKNKVYGASILKKELKIGSKSCKPFCENIINNLTETDRRKNIANIILKIINFDKKIKLKYINQLKNPDLIKLKKLILLLITGTHTLDLLKEKINFNLSTILENAKDYEIYYLYKNNNFICRENNFLEYTYFLKKREIQININELETSFKICSGNLVILNIAVNWKNKFQGIETPSLNIFLGNFLE